MNVQLSLFVPVFVNTGNSIGGRSRTLVTRVWNPVRNHCAPTWPVTGQKKRAACCRYPAQTAPGGLSTRRSPRRTACTQARLDAELVVIDGAVAHGSQACRQSHAAGPPGFSRVLRAVHDVSSGSWSLRELVSPIPADQVNAFPGTIVPGAISSPLRRTPALTGSPPPSPR